MEIPEFLNKMLIEQYGQKITQEIIDGFKAKRKTTFRVNTLKTTVDKIESQLLDEGVEFNKPLWSKEAFIINNKTEKDIEKMPMYENGEIYIQSLSSMLPPIIVEPKEKTDILDMAAAPGGKTTELAALTNNNANITACEMNKIRSERLKYNIKKQGATSVFVMETDSRRLNNLFSFDQVLLDSPCSGSGTISLEDENLKNYFTEKLVSKCQKIQLELLEKAIKVLKVGQDMVYSTCSILACENEEIVNKVLKKEKCEIVPIIFNGMEEIQFLKTKIEGAICIAPNELYEGFFIAKIRKKG